MMGELRLAAVFGVPLRLSESDADEIQGDLSHFASLAGHDLGTVSGRDRYQEFLDELTDPVRRESSVRESIADVAASEVGPSTPYGERLFHRVEARRWVPSREGIAVYELLEASRTDAGVAIGYEAAAAVAVTVVGRYRRQSLYRLDRVTGLLSGVGGRLLVPPLAQLTLLLLNRSTHPDRALPKYPRAHGLDEVARAFREGVFHVGRLIRTDLRPPKDPSEWELGGYTLSEINRRLLPPGLMEVRLQLPGIEDSVEGVCLAPERVEDGLHLLATELASRFAGSIDRVSQFLDSALGVYSAYLKPTLATRGLAHETPKATHGLRRDVIEGVSRAQALSEAE